MVSVRLRFRRAVDEARFRLGRAVPVAVFMYHSVHPDAATDWGPWQYAVTPETFERQLARITDRYEVRPLADVLAACRGGDPPTQPTAAITFDDGFRDNLTEALPLLERYDAPATVYVAGKYLDGPAPYEYRLAAAVQSASRVAVDADGTRIERTLTDDRSRREAYEELRRELKFAPAAARETAVEAIDSDGTVEAIEGAVPAMLTGAELRELAASPLVEIGAHGYDHVPLTTLDGDALQSDIDRAKSTLEAALSEPVTQFSYPYGDHSDGVARAVERAGFESAVTTVPRRLPASRFDSAAYRIPRYDGAQEPTDEN